jgi:tetratricopeptide (TPR) repeat protein
MVRAELDPAIATLERAGHAAGLARAWSLAGMLRFWRGDNAGATGELERAAELANAAADRLQEMQCATTLTLSALLCRAHVAAMQGRHADARRLVAEVETIARDRGAPLSVSNRRAIGDIQRLGGDLVAAEQTFRALADTMAAMGDWGHLVSLVPDLADVLYAQGRGEEAAPAIEDALQRVIEDDTDAQVGLGRVRARLLAQRGQTAEAIEFARAAVERASASDGLELQAKALADLGEVLDADGDLDGAAAAFDEAALLFERKGMAVRAGLARERRAALGTVSL